MFDRMAKTLSIKHFTDLTADELYDVAQVRETVLRTELFFTLIRKLYLPVNYVVTL